MRPFKSWESAIESFLDDLKIGRTARTVQSISTRLDLMKEISSEPKTLTRTDYMNWVESLRKKHEPSYAKAANNDLMRLLRYIRHPLEPRLRLYRIPIPAKPIEVYTDDELVTIAQWCMKEHETRTRRRVAVFLAIAIGSGLRSAEITALEWKHWDASKRRFRVMATKTKVAGWVKVTKFAVPLIEAWREEAKGEWVFPSFRFPGMHLKPNALNSILNRVVKRELNMPGLTIKKFRSTTAKLVFEQCRSLETTAAVLRHESIETTRRFYHRIEMDRASDEAHDEAFASLINRIQGDEINAN